MCNHQNSNISYLHLLYSNRKIFLMINSCFYYYIAKQAQSTSKILTATEKETGKGFILQMKQQNDETYNQLWMFKPNEQDNAFYILNCKTGLVFQVGKNRTIELHHLKQKDFQLFKFNCLSAQNMAFTISEYNRNSTLFFRNETLVVDFAQQNSFQSKWILKRVLKSTMLSHSLIFQNQFSGYVLDVSDNAEKDGGILQQKDWSGTFSQRWVLQKFKDFYFIKNLKSNLVATVKGKKSKEGSSIVQQKQSEHHNKFQLWDIQERGHRLYEIRLACDRQLYFHTELQDLTVGGQIILMKSPNKLWRIIGEVKI